jgi:hypothetical protein
MKKSLVLLFVFGLVLSGFSQKVASASASKPAPTAVFAWANTTYDFGKTKVGVPVAYEFRFSNTGLAPLIITSVKASCGCTVTAYTKEPVEHGGSGIVKATYDAAKTGVYSKTVAVSANTPEGLIHLTIKGEIIE